MPIQRLFNKKPESEHNPDLLGYIRQLFKMAHTDGHMDECEYHFILQVARRLELEVDFESLHEELSLQDFDFNSHSKYGFDLLFDLSWLILVDGEVDEAELTLGSEIASRMGYPTEKVKKMVKAIGQHKKMGLPPMEIREKLKVSFTEPS